MNTGFMLSIDLLNNLQSKTSTTSILYILLLAYGLATKRKLKATEASVTSVMRNEITIKIAVAIIRDLIS